MLPSVIQVSLDGQNVQDLAPFMLALDCTVVEEINQHTTTVVRFREPPSDRFFFESQIGKRMVVTVSVNFTRQTQQQEVFNGFVQRVDADWELNGSAILTFTGISDSFKLDTFNHSQTFRSSTLADVAKRMGIKTNVKDLPADLMNMLQFNETDWSFANRLADRFGCFLMAAGAFKVGGLETETIMADGFGANAVQLAWRSEDGLTRFRSSGQLKPHLVFGVNFESKTATSKETLEIGDVPAEDSMPELRSAAFNGSGALGLTSALWNRYLLSSHEGFEKQVNFESQRQIMSQCRGFGESRSPLLAVGRTIEITGNPDINGKYGLIKIIHRWGTTEGYRNEFECTPFKKYMSPVAPKMDRYFGPEIARVVETSPPGPRGASVRVQFQWEKENETNFIPVVMPNAGPDRGICFVPEVGDEVLVSFRGGDSCKPFVMGSLWNGVDLPPLKDLHGGEYPPNDLKRIVTKSGNRLVFDDKPGKETMVMATPNHVRVSLFDGGQTLVLHSDGDVHIHAGGTVHMKCKQFLREVG